MPDSTLKITAPYDEHLIQEIPLTSWEELDGILDASNTLFHNRSKRLPKYERIKILNRFRELLIENQDSLAKQAAEEGGKPLVDSLIEVRRAVNGIEIAVQELGQMRGTEIPMELTESSVNHIAYTMLEPAGVVVAISAFNHPVNLIIHQVVPAVAVGCPVIVKPAAATPLSCFAVVKLLHQAGLPEEWCTAVVCDREASARLASDSRIAFVSFIGSAKVGWNLRKNLAPGVNCALEHGGAAPVIVEPDVNIDNILPGIVKGGYYHAGQVCVSVQRLFVHKEIMSAVKDKLIQLVKSLKVGDPLDMSTEVGPLIKPGEVDRVEMWVKDALDNGAELLCGGVKISNTCYEPTILLNPPQNAKVTTEEIFGPVVCLYEYDNYLDAVESANNVPFNFQASIYTENLNTALDCAKRLKGKAVMVNEHTAFRVDWMPFGGAEMSGLGTGGIGYSMRDMCHEKMIVIKSNSV
jgi:acyl-CoA reductase-like NAD-dependent aldehyde dehydrogenase